MTNVNVPPGTPGPTGPAGPPGAGNPAGSDTQIQFNNSGVFGASSGLTVNKSSGDITAIHGVVTSFPAFQGGSSTVLTNDGFGNLSWGAGGGGGGSPGGSNTQVQFNNSGSFDGTSNLTFSSGLLYALNLAVGSVSQFTVDVSGDVIAGSVYSQNGGSNSNGILIGSVTASDGYPGIWFGSNTAAPSYSNYAFLHDSSNGTILNSPSSKLNFRIGNSDYAILNTDGLSINNGGSGCGSGVGLTVATGYVGIGTTTPGALLDVNGDIRTGSIGINGGYFAVNSSGNITALNGLVTSFPSVQGGSGDVLTNNGSGTLTWGPPGATLTGDVTTSMGGGTVVSSAKSGAIVFDSSGISSPRTTAFPDISGFSNPMIAYGTAVNTTAPIAMIGPYPNVPAGTYEVGGYLSTQNMSAGAPELTVTYADENGATRTRNLILTDVTGNSFTAAAPSGYYSGQSLSIRTSGSDYIRLSVDGTILSGTVNAWCWVRYASP